MPDPSVWSINLRGNQSSPKYGEVRRAKGLCLRCGKRSNEPDRTMCLLCLEQARSKAKERRKQRPEVFKERDKKSNQERQRRDYWNIVIRLGGCCVCCGETTPEFLSIDHKNHDGAAKRKLFGSNIGREIRWYQAQQLPIDHLQVLCWNCHMSKDFRGFCPHTKDAHA